MSEVLTWVCIYVRGAHLGMHICQRCSLGYAYMSEVLTWVCIMSEGMHYVRGAHLGMHYVSAMSVQEITEKLGLN